MPRPTRSYLESEKKSQGAYYKRAAVKARKKPKPPCKPTAIVESRYVFNCNDKDLAKDLRAKCTKLKRIGSTPWYFFKVKKDGSLVKASRLQFTKLPRKEFHITIMGGLQLTFKGSKLGVAEREFIKPNGYVHSEQIFCKRK
jgi:hypothetical protein